MYGGARIFSEECKMVAESVEGPVIVCKEGEEFDVSEDERQAMALGPKFCVVGDLSEEEFETAVEECIAKLRWDMMSEEDRKRKEDPAMAAISEVIDEDQVEELRIHEMMKEGEKQAVHLMEEERSTWNFTKRRVTGFKGNSRVVLPKKSKEFKEEAALETVRTELMHTFREYAREFGKESSRRNNVANGYLSSDTAQLNESE